jgi:hypothetical protein
LKQQANQTFFNHLTKQQIYLHEQQMRLRGDRKASSNKGGGRKGGEELLNPIVYYENRYFPFGFDDPEKVALYN